MELLDGRLRLRDVVDAMDEGLRTTCRRWSWVGVLLLLAMPGRLALAHLLLALWRLNDPRAHGDALTLLTSEWLGLWLIGLYGRQVFVRACRVADGHGRWWEPLAVPPPLLLAHLVGATAIAFLFFALLWTVVIPPFLLPLAALTAIAPGITPPAHGGIALLTGPLRGIARILSPNGLLLVAPAFAVALGLALINLHLVTQLGMWLAQLAVPPAVLANWDLLLSFDSPTYVTLLLAGASLAVEPFWLAVLNAVGGKVRSRSTGEDLSAWFAALRMEQQTAQRAEAQP